VLIVTVGLHMVDCGRVLVQQRPSDKMGLKGCWEFPGGKLEDGETLKQALKREWKEELGVVVEVGRLIDEHVIHFEGIGNVLLPLFEVFFDRKTQNAAAKEGQVFHYMEMESALALPCVPTMLLYGPAVVSHASAKRQTSRPVESGPPAAESTLPVLEGKDLPCSQL